jgi:hypothetical protein
MCANALTGAVGVAGAAPDPLPVPPLGSVATQFVTNQINSVLALAPIVLGSTEQCTVCIGPTANTPGGLVSGFTGWGLIGIVDGTIGAPEAFISKLIAGGGIGEAIGNGLASIQYPIANTFTLLSAPRNFGGLDLGGALLRAQISLNDLVSGVGNLLTQALVTGPVNLVFSVVAATTLFVNALSKGETLINAINAGRGFIRKGIDENQEALSLKFNNLRRALFNDVNGAPGLAVNPIPVLPAPPTAAVRAVVEPKPAASAAAPIASPPAELAGRTTSVEDVDTARGEARSERPKALSVAAPSGDDPTPTADNPGPRKPGKATQRSAKRGSATAAG